MLRNFSPTEKLSETFLPLKNFEKFSFCWEIFLLLRNFYILEKFSSCWESFPLLRYVFFAKKQFCCWVNFLPLLLSRWENSTFCWENFLPLRNFEIFFLLRSFEKIFFLFTCLDSFLLTRIFLLLRNFSPTEKHFSRWETLRNYSHTEKLWETFLYLINFLLLRIFSLADKLYSCRETLLKKGWRNSSPAEKIWANLRKFKSPWETSPFEKFFSPWDVLRNFSLTEKLYL